MEQKNTQLHEKIRSLEDQVVTLRDENTRLKKLYGGGTAAAEQQLEATQLQDKNRALQEENLKLKNDLKDLRSALALLVQKGQDTSVESAPPQGGSSHT